MIRRLCFIVAFVWFVCSGTGYANSSDSLNDVEYGFARDQLTEMGYPAGTGTAPFDVTARTALRKFQSDLGLEPDGDLSFDMAVIVRRIYQWRLGEPGEKPLSSECRIRGGARRSSLEQVKLVSWDGACPGGNPSGILRITVEDNYRLFNPWDIDFRQVYEGELFDGLYHGPGRYSFADGTMIHGYWDRGRFRFSRELDARQRLRSAQLLLAEHGYDPGPADGLMGTKTGNAIRAFQKDAGLKVDGQPSTALLSQLRSKAVTAHAEDREDDDYIEFELEFLLAREGYDPERYPGDPDRQLAAAAQAYRTDWQMPAGTPYDHDIVDMLTQVDARTRPGWQVLEGSRCKAWNDWPHARETLVWSGACPGGKASGDGILKGRFMLNGDWVTHNKYEGVLENGKANGYGARYYLSGRSITGIWKDGQPHGFAFEHFPTGSSYSGGWAEGERHGQGTLTDADGTETKTEWVKGERVK
ncbi:MAG: peptidoglycan-binding protein [Minwuia sp.]|uniref:peptidoglycan-binding protein n=1 Tax=Minwuia sp. TaxID=2493630 RepID=UPI003A890AFB